MRRALVALLLAAGLLIAGMGTAGALPIVPLPGIQVTAGDGKTPPIPEKPTTSGAFAGLFNQERPDAGSDAGRYETYGLSGYFLPTYDLGTDPTDSGDNMLAPAISSVADFGFMTAKFGLSLAGALLDVAYSGGDWLPAFDGLLTRGTRATYDGITEPFSLVMLPLLGLVLLAQARHARWAAVGTAVAFAVGGLVVASALVQYPVKAGSFADQGMVETQGAIARSIGGNASSPGLAAMESAVDAILYQRWLDGMLGSSKTDTAQKLGPALYESVATSWADSAAGDKDPERAREIVAEKQADFTRIAEEIKDSDPDAYEHLTGKKYGSRLAAGATAVLAALCVLPFLIMSALVLIGAFLVIRMMVIFGPAVAIFAILPATHVIARGALSVVAAAIINSLIFGAGLAVTVLGVDVLLDPSSAIPGWLGLLLLALWSAIMWGVLKPFRRLTSMVSPSKNMAGDAASTISRSSKKTSSVIKSVATTAGAAYVGGKAAGAGGGAAKPDEATADRGETFTQKPRDAAPYRGQPSTETFARPQTERVHNHGGQPQGSPIIGALPASAPVAQPAMTTGHPQTALTAEPAPAATGTDVARWQPQPAPQAEPKARAGDYDPGTGSHESATSATPAPEPIAYEQGPDGVYVLEDAALR